eukprot:2829787-Rhodomonas_salina.1
MAANTNVLLVAAPRVAPRLVPAALKVSLEACAHHIVEPDRPLALFVGSAARVFALRRAHLLECALGVAKDPTHGLCTAVGKAVVAHSAPLVVMLDLQTANLAVAIHEPEVVVRPLWATRKVARTDALPDTASRDTVAAETNIITMLAVAGAPWLVSTVADVPLVPFTFHLAQPDFTRATSFPAIPAALVETKGLAHRVCALLRETIGAHRTPRVLELDAQKAARRVTVIQAHRLCLRSRAEVLAGIPS